MKRQIAVTTCAGILGILGMFASIEPVRAECPFSPTFPPVTHAVRSAREIIVGTVISYVDDPSLFVFKLRIDHVLRGSATVGEVRVIRGLRPQWPIYTNEYGTYTPCTMLEPELGNVIAIAFDAIATDGETRYNAAGWLHGSSQWMQQEERVSLADLKALAALPMTDAEPARSHATPTQPPWLLLLLSAALGVAAVDRRRRSAGGGVKLD